MEKRAPLLSRFLTYQRERFPLLGHGVLISVFTFSAIAYSRICRGEPGFVPWGHFLIGAAATITLFLLVRIFDEHKDREDDAHHRPYLPVPRGLISLRELRGIGIAVGLLQLALIAFLQPAMFPLYALVIGYLMLMGAEFFVPTWLKQRQILYITSHMFIIPLIDLYASGIDWKLDGDSPHWGLAWFFAVSYMNGLVLEFGRKLRAPGGEEEGVITYTSMYGTRGGVLRWLGLLLSTFLLAVGAMWYAGIGPIPFALLCANLSFGLWATWRFLRNPNEAHAKALEQASIAWTIGMYLCLGGITMIMELISG